MWASVSYSCLVTWYWDYSSIQLIDSNNNVNNNINNYVDNDVINSVNNNVNNDVSYEDYYTQSMYAEKD